MSLESSPNAANRSTVDPHLDKLYEPNDSAVQKASLNARPKSFRQQIFDNICKQAERLVEVDYAEVRVFDLLPRLPQVVKKGATHALDFLDQTEKNQIAWEISDHHGPSFSQDGNWVRNHAGDNIPFLPDLPEMKHASLGDLTSTSELENIVDEWVRQAKSGEDRTEAQCRIIHFLKDATKKELVLDGLGLRSLPGIFNKKLLISRLVRLDLSDNELTWIPEQIGLLQNLTTLDLSRNQLRSIPEQIGLLQHLTTLDLSRNQLRSIPEGIGQLENLNYLDLSNNQLRLIPKKIRQLRNLTILDLSNNQLRSILKQIGQLQNLTTLSLSNNRLTSIPKKIGRLRYLKYLDLSNNCLRLIPEQIGELQNLTTLDLYNNQLRLIPKEICLLGNLTDLDLSRNQLRSISKKIGWLWHLNYLDLSNNWLRSISERIGELWHLNYLDLSGNHLTSIPDRITQLKNLIMLNLNNNPKLKRLPHGLINLANRCYVFIDSSVY